MDIVWLVLDSLGFRHTPFYDDGPETMPRFRHLAERSGVLFSRAYAPGPSSPSSHGSFFTGELPADTGMHEAHPYFDGRVPTIADALSETHKSTIVSVNPFLFNGLSDSFDVATDLAAEQYLIFGNALNPRDFGNRTDAARGLPRIRAYITETFADGTPVRSFANAVKFKLWQRRGNDFIPQNVSGESNTYQYAGLINERVRNALNEPGPSLVIANYMDVHPPFDATDEAIKQFADTDADLPIGVRDVDTERYDYNAMETLYHAAIWDLDAKITPLVEELIDNGTFVVVTADHGPRFGDDDLLGEDRLHVPLLVFDPKTTSQRVDHTVNLRSLPHTTMESVDGGGDQFEGYDLLSVEADRLSVTEHVHSPSEDDSPVNPYGDGEVAYDLYLRRGDAWLRDDDDPAHDGSAEAVAELETTAAELRETRKDVAGGDRVDYDAETEERLESLGYL
jgi:arylsulfatase A-like enzyme